MDHVTMDGDTVPAVGLGTWNLDGDACRTAVSTALELGYRHVDTAQAYGNEAAVGRAVAEAAVDREDVFLTTKVAATHRTPAAIVSSVWDSLERLGVDRVDLLLIHWPNPLADLGEVMRGLDRSRDAGLTRHVGVSNFGVDRLERARELADSPIVTDQVQCHPWYPQRELREYCAAEGVTLTAYSPLARGALIDDDVLATVGRRYDKTPAQIAIRWAIQHEGVLAIPKSASRQHLAENIDVFDFELTGEELAEVERPSRLRTGLSMVRGQLPV